MRFGAIYQTEESAEDDGKVTGVAPFCAGNGRWEVDLRITTHNTAIQKDGVAGSHTVEIDIDRAELR
jgi:hypothetical protein